LEPSKNAKIKFEKDLNELQELRALSSGIVILIRKLHQRLNNNYNQLTLGCPLPWVFKCITSLLPVIIALATSRTFKVVILPAQHQPTSMVTE
jgi:hypothetical protein